MAADGTAPHCHVKLPGHIFAWRKLGDGDFKHYSMCWIVETQNCKKSWTSNAFVELLYIDLAQKEC